jgi:hypothetical protein
MDPGSDQEVTRSIEAQEVRSKGDAAPVIHVQILHVPECPLVGGLRSLLEWCLSRSGLHAAVEEIEGPYPSPTLLIDGVDPTGRPTSAGASCRLDPPTEDEVLAALTQAEAQRLRLSPGEEDERCA